LRELPLERDARNRGHAFRCERADPAIGAVGSVQSLIYPFKGENAEQNDLEVW
jgi:hypothetical protein